MRADCRNAVPSIVADYRATATIDIEHDRADLAAGHRLTLPVTVLQQDWGSVLGFDAAAVWRPWVADLHHVTTRAGHFMAEEAPADTAAMLAELLRR
ncbi:hydrolase [Nocardia sp. alder85J]|uniref:hydrolase n=1 Tax=Nocardia sp. alder85J TaxID=2862949 RepID=UPI001CD727A9|nr:hydrolase [Nocardia sp. alder85J]MCX4098534.1 hydrolase [Nocardia sp. alder85J]